MWPTYINVYSQIDEIQVSDFITHNKEEDMNLLVAIFPTEMLNQLSIMPSANVNWADQLM